MNIEIPDFLLEMSKQMHEQDNRITADPIWMVCYDDYLPTKEDYADKTQLIYGRDDPYIVIDDTENCSHDGEAIANFIEEYDIDYAGVLKEFDMENISELREREVIYRFDLEYLPEPFEVIHLMKRQTIVKACLTEADANWFIKRKQHDYAKLYTYVFSMHYCPQMIELRNWILSLT